GWAVGLLSSMGRAGVVGGALALRAILPESGGRAASEPAAPPIPAVSMRAIWLIAATAALAAGLWRSRLPFRAALHVPVTPLDYSNERLADRWHFVDDARYHRPSGARFPVLAPDLGDASVSTLAA